jgi:hypothetical protein
VKAFGSLQRAFAAIRSRSPGSTIAVSGRYAAPEGIDDRVGASRPTS